MIFKTFSLVALFLAFTFNSFAQEKKSDLDVELDNLSKSSELFDKSFISGMLPASIKDAAKSFMKENPFSLISESEVKEMLKLKLSNTPVGDFYNENPKYFDFTVKWIRDKKAIPSLFSILNKPEKMKTYGVYFLIVFVISFFLQLRSYSKGIVKRIFSKIAITIAAFSTNLILFYVVFKVELTPTIDLFFKTI